MNYDGITTVFLVQRIRQRSKANMVNKALLASFSKTPHCFFALLDFQLWFHFNCFPFQTVDGLSDVDLSANSSSSGSFQWHVFHLEVLHMCVRIRHSVGLFQNQFRTHKYESAIFDPTFWNCIFSTPSNIPAVKMEIKSDFCGHLVSFWAKYLERS